MKKFNEWLKIRENNDFLKKKALEVKFSIRKIIQEAANNNVVYEKLKFMERKFDSVFMYIDLDEEGFVYTLNILIEEIEQYTIGQIQDYLNTKNDQNDILKYYPGFSEDDFNLYIEKLQKIIDVATTIGTN